MSDKSEISELHTVDRVFDLLDRQRHLPAYQLERLAGVFFTLFLPEVLEKEKKISQVRRPLIPEFPILTKREDNSSEKENTKKKKISVSKKIDYFALSKDGKRAFIIELKTDMNSINQKQIDFLECTRGQGTRCLIEDVIRLINNENNPKPTPKPTGMTPKRTRNKYVHLLSHLRCLDLVCYDEEELYKKAFANISKNVYQTLKSVKPARRICDDEPKLEVIYIQPKPNGDPRIQIPSDGHWHRMYFDFFADHVEERGPIGRRFAKSLRRWKERAGSCPPKP